MLSPLTYASQKNCEPLFSTQPRPLSPPAQPSYSCLFVSALTCLLLIASPAVYVFSDRSPVWTRAERGKSVVSHGALTVSSCVFPLGFPATGAPPARREASPPGTPAFKGVFAQ